MLLQKLARWWQDAMPVHCRDCGLAVADAIEAAALWDEDQEVILAAREMVADGAASGRLTTAIAARDARLAARTAR